MISKSLYILNELLIRLNFLFIRNLNLYKGVKFHFEKNFNPLTFQNRYFVSYNFLIFSLIFKLLLLLFHNSLFD